MASLKSVFNEKKIVIEKNYEFNRKLTVVFIDVENIYYHTLFDGIGKLTRVCCERKVYKMDHRV